MHFCFLVAGLLVALTGTHSSFAAVPAASASQSSAAFHVRVTRRRRKLRRCSRGQTISKDFERPSRCEHLSLRYSFSRLEGLTLKGRWTVPPHTRFSELGYPQQRYHGEHCSHQRPSARSTKPMAALARPGITRALRLDGRQQLHGSTILIIIKQTSHS